MKDESKKKPRPLQTTLLLLVSVYILFWYNFKPTGKPWDYYKELPYVPYPDTLIVLVYFPLSIYSYCFQTIWE